MYPNKDPLFIGTIPDFGSMDPMKFKEADRQRWNWGRNVVEKPKESYGQEIPPILDK